MVKLAKALGFGMDTEIKKTIKDLPEDERPRERLVKFDLKM